MLSNIPSATLLGVVGYPVSVEVHVSGGIPSFTIVGLPDTSVREARDRVRAALLSSGFEWPLRRGTVNLAPSGLRKMGAGLDLAIAIGLLVAQGVVKTEVVDGYGFVGELGLDGSIRPVRGTLPMVEAMDVPRIVVPVANAREARALGAKDVFVAQNLRELVTALTGEGDGRSAGRREDDVGQAPSWFAGWPRSRHGARGDEDSLRRGRVVAR